VLFEESAGELKSLGFVLLATVIRTGAVRIHDAFASKGQGWIERYSAVPRDVVHYKSRVEFSDRLDGVPLRVHDVDGFPGACILVDTYHRPAFLSVRVLCGSEMHEVALFLEECFNGAFARDGCIQVEVPRLKQPEMKGQQSGRSRNDDFVTAHEAPQGLAGAKIVPLRDGVHRGG